MREQLVKAEYNEETGESTVMLNTRWGVFTRTVKVHEEDKDVANKWDGCKFAHYLCRIDAMKAEARAYDERAIGLRHGAAVLMNASMTSVYWNYSPDSVLELYCLAEDFEKRAENIRNIVAELKNKYPEICEKTLAARRATRARENK